MKITVKLLNNPVVLVTLLALGCVTDLILLGQAYELSKSDWGTWVGSIGTVATLAMTIWLATDASRTKRNEQLNLALVTAAHFKVRLRNVVRVLAQARNALATPLNQPDDPRVMFGDISQRFSDDDLWTADELVPLVYLPNQLAARLAWIGTRVRSLRLEYRNYSAATEPIEWDVMELLSRTITYELNESLAEIQRVMAELTNFQIKHNFEFAVPRYNQAHAAEQS
ncbi:hypothetical protein [Massilia sp. Leaf139]|uniref:hypothetical protein n=1 Tax=Massilia sp. Leaf139 TaxID=1736272 RepID=UPI0006FC2B87|nr:hypothetical protein [Massilia sp. Leaf139]KQQ93653.1 hypothetical protein ASF77_22485 [Massilia sp. Leaf139]